MKIERLQVEYIIIEEAARLIEEFKVVLPESRSMALFELSEVLEKDLSEKEFRKEARAAIIRELMEYLETELNPPPRPRPRLITKMAD